MKSLRFMAASLFMLSVIGCCSGRNVVSDSCDPCGGMSCPTCSSPKIWPFQRNFGNRWSSNCGACPSCGSCDCGDMTMDSGFTSGSCGAPSCGGCGCGSPSFSSQGMTGSSGCGCGQSQSFSQPTSYSSQMNSNSQDYIPSSPTPLNSSPQSAPMPPMNSSPSTPPPPAIPGSDSSAMLPPVSGSQPQMVSYEEFQKLPGTIVSGPGAGPTTASTPMNISSPIQQTAAKVQPSLAQPSPKTGSQNRQALWVPTKAY